MIIWAGWLVGLEGVRERPRSSERGESLTYGGLGMVYMDSTHLGAHKERIGR